MSVALVIRDTKDAQQRLVPIATQVTFASTWLPGIVELGLQWSEMMETGFDIVMSNREPVLAELPTLRAWMVDRASNPSILARLDTLVQELSSIRFGCGSFASRSTGGVSIT